MRNRVISSEHTHIRFAVWEAKYAPHYVVPWTVILISYILCIVLLLVLRWGLSRENKRRDLLSAVSDVPIIVRCRADRVFAGGQRSLWLH